MNWVLCKQAGNTLINMDGTVRSLNPTTAGPAPRSYQWQTRPAGTAGDYELETIDVGTVTYNPMGDEPVVFGFKASVPNAPGYCAVSVQPL